MTLRHIRPRSVEWYDALMDQKEREVELLSPEQKLKLRAMRELEELNAGFRPGPLRQRMRLASAP